MTGAALVVQGDAVPDPDGRGGLPLPDSSVDAIVTDPPYALPGGFMGRTWDRFSGPQQYQAWCQAWAAEALRVLRPGGWLLSFGGTRTWHRLACGIEDAGFEMRDTIAEFGPLAWVYGSGFPKGKACLKPAWEPVLVARKPGSSVLQIDAARVGRVDGDRTEYGRDHHLPHANTTASLGKFTEVTPYEPHTSGRWPANVVLVHDPGCVPVGVRKIRNHDGPKDAPRLVSRDDETDWRFKAGEQPGYGTETVTAWDCQPDCPVFLLDQQSGERVSGGSPAGSSLNTGLRGNTFARQRVPREGDQGGASRFYPTFQAETRFHYTAKAPRNERVTIDGEGHPTVKPLSLVRWLVRLVTPPGGLILDMFGGSGTTGEAAMLEGFTCLVLDNDPASCAKAKVRAHPHVRRRTVVTGPLAVPEQGSLL